MKIENCPSCGREASDELCVNHNGYEVSVKCACGASGRKANAYNMLEGGKNTFVHAMNLATEKAIEHWNTVSSAVKKGRGIPESVAAQVVKDLNVMDQAIGEIRGYTENQSFLNITPTRKMYEKGRRLLLDIMKVISERGNASVAYVDVFTTEGYQYITKNMFCDTKEGLKVMLKSFSYAAEVGLRKVSKYMNTEGITLAIYGIEDSLWSRLILFIKEAKNFLEVENTISESTQKSMNLWFEQAQEAARDAVEDIVDNEMDIALRETILPSMFIAEFDEGSDIEVEEFIDAFASFSSMAISILYEGKYANIVSQVNDECVQTVISNGDKILNQIDNELRTTD